MKQSLNSRNKGEYNKDNNNMCDAADLNQGFNTSPSNTPQVLYFYIDHHNNWPFHIVSKPL